MSHFTVPLIFYRAVGNQSPWEAPPLSNSIRDSDVPCPCSLEPPPSPSPLGHPAPTPGLCGPGLYLQNTRFLATSQDLGPRAVPHAAGQ